MFKTYSSDQPIRSRTEDRFDRWPFAQRVAETIAKRRDSTSLVLGIYGPWGDGKTSVLRMMEEVLARYDYVTVLQFNPWHFQSERDLIRAFFDSIAEALGKKLETRAEEIGGWLKKYGAVLSVASVGGVKELGESLSTVQLDELKSRVDAALREDERRLVVLIDDVDRLDESEIHSIFKLVKLSASFENVSYVLSFDDEVVASSLGRRYGAGDKSSGREFLDKIVQVPLHLPPADQIALRQVIASGIQVVLEEAEIDASQIDGYAFWRHFADGIEVRLRTPRQAKRYVNALAFALPLLKGEVNTLDQMLIEAVRVFYPKLYPHIRDNRDVFLGKQMRIMHGAGESELKKQYLRVLESGIADLNADDKESAKNVLQVLFPRLKGVWGNTFYGDDSEENWSKEQRICADAYFDRYFKYTVPIRDVSDAMVRDLSSGRVEDPEAAVERICAAGAAGKLVGKLRANEKQIEPERALRLAQAIAKRGGDFPVEKQMFGDMASTSTQAAILFRNLLLRLTPAHRERAISELFDSIQSVPFAMRCFRWVKVVDEGEERVISVESEEHLGKIIAGKIVEQANITPPYRVWPDDCSSALWIWKHYCNDPDLGAWLTDHFDQHPEEIPEFLSRFAPEGWGLESGLPLPGRLMREGYNAVAEFLPADLIVERLLKHYGPGIANSEFEANSSDRHYRLSRQFIEIHRFVEKQRHEASTTSEPVPEPEVTTPSATEQPAD